MPCLSQEKDDLTSGNCQNPNALLECVLFAIWQQTNYYLWNDRMRKTNTLPLMYHIQTGKELKCSWALTVQSTCIFKVTHWLLLNE